MQNYDDIDNDFLSDDEDFLPITPSNDEKTSNEENSEKIISLDEIIKPDDSTITDEKENTQILEDVVSSIPDISVSETLDEEIQNKKSNKMIYKYAKVLPVIAFTFVSVLGIYIFIHNVNADIINLIKIVEKEKVGYINNEGNVIVKPKYLYGSDYYKGYAIVKNYNNLYGIIDGKGDTEISFGNIFSANLYGNRYIVSKFTNDGLKMGLLDSSLKEVTRIKYDNLSYSKSGIFMYTYNDTMGVMNNDGKEIYSYKVDEVDDKNISVEVSNVDSKTSDATYAKIKINSSSTIINILTGNEVYKYTLDDIMVLDNNVFYIKNETGNNKYFIIKDDRIIYQTDQYKRVRVEDIDSNIAIGIKDDSTLDYINLLTKEKINTDGNVKYTYSDGVVLQEMYNFQTSKNEFNVITPEKTIGSFYDVKLDSNEFVNGYIKIITENNKYNFINKNGNIISKKEYEEASDFNENGYAIVSNDKTYGVIDTSGKEVINLKYDNIKFIDDTLFNSIYKTTGQELFIFKENNKYGIINSDGKIVVKAIYDNFKTVTTKYPIIKAKYEGSNVLINLETFKELSINATNSIQIYKDYIISKDEYYNYNGQLIYTVGD